MTAIFAVRTIAAEDDDEKLAVGSFRAKFVRFTRFVRDGKEGRDK